MGRSGIAPETTIVLYGDNNSWFAAYAYRMLACRGHRRARLMNGGRVVVLAELRGCPRVRNCDGSWTEWGSAVRLPIER